MSEESINYGNWVPRNFLYFWFGIFLIFSVLFLILELVIFKIIFGILAGLGFILFAYFTYSYLVFSANNNELQNKLRDLVLNLLPWNGKGRVLDIGTGNEPLAISSAKKFQHAKVTGIDYWGKGWNYAQKMCEKNAISEGVGDQTHFQKASAMNLPFNDGEFDAAITNFVFHEVREAKDKRDVIQETLRVIPKGGAFSFQDLFLVKKFYGDLDELLKTIQGWGVENVNYIKPGDLVKIPLLVRTPFMLGKIAILYGKK